MHESLKYINETLNQFFIYYFFVLGSIYLLLCFLSFFKLKQYLNRQTYKDLKEIFRLKKFKSISLIVPAYNEEAGIITSVQALLQLEYPEYQIIVVNDGSKDKTLSLLQEKFNAVEIPYLPYNNLPTQKVRSVFLCKGYKNLILVDKENGGKADSINAGINISENELIIVVDADSIIERDGLLKVSYPFMENENIVAVGGTIRIANGCDINKGFVENVGLPKSWLAKFQVVEYLRAFMFGRNGFDAMDGILIISGAFSCFKKDVLVKIGGFLNGCIGEDMEIIVRIQRLFRNDNPETRIAIIPDPVCWTEAPETLKTLGLQRKRWQKGTIISLLLHRKLLFNSQYGLLGMVVFPYFIIFEMLGPIIEVFGYFVFLVSVIFGLVPLSFTIVFLSVAILYGVILSLLSVIFEELTFKKYSRYSHLLELFVIAIVENFGYRQISSYFRFKGTLEYFLGDREWGKMEKKGLTNKL
ncbi:MAG: glycosyltransferase [Bacteroidetes bacterium]|nr:glycosyltransferase [Bacteroidota bacterium]